MDLPSSNSRGTTNKTLTTKKQNVTIINSQRDARKRGAIMSQKAIIMIRNLLQQKINFSITFFVFWIQ